MKALARGACLAVLAVGVSGCADTENPSRSDSPGEDGATGVREATIEAARAITERSIPESFEVRAVLVGAGDIARCSSTGHDQTAQLLDGIEGVVFTLGDHAYPDGGASRFAECYERSWGRHRGRTRPTPGNHDYRASGGAGYFDYFGDAAGPARRGYYSYDLGGWHVLALNSVVSLHGWSPQMAWVRLDLAGNRARCTVAYWHESRFSSGEHGSSAAMRAVWEVLYEHGVDIVVTAHDHIYERFAPQTPAGVRDDERGIRAFVVGTGGADLRPLGAIAANSEFRDVTNFGVLKLELGDGAYRWSFVTIPRGEVTDSGVGQCH